MKPLYWFTRNALRTYFTLFHGYKVYGAEHSVPGRAILAPNHASFYDPSIVSISLSEEISFLARKTLFSSWIFGSLISSLNAYPVDTSSQDVSSLKLICRLLAEDKKVVIFPEGKRTHDGELQPIKHGIGMLALRAQAPIIPIYIHGTYEVWNRYDKFPKMRGHIACVFGTPIDRRDFEGLDKKAAQEAIAIKVGESIANLKTWYLNGAKGTPP